MLNAKLKQVPAYYLTFENHTIPFIISLLFIDKENCIKLPPAVECSINTVISITKIETLAYIKLKKIKHENLQYYFKQTLKNKAILLFLCPSVELAEALMTYLHNNYTLSLMKEEIKP